MSVQPTECDMIPEPNADHTVAVNDDAADSQACYRIVIFNWPNFCGPKDVTRILKQRGMFPKKVNMTKTKVFVTFDTQELCNTAIGLINGFKMKNRILEVRSASPDWRRSKKGIKTLRRRARVPDTIMDAVTPLYKVVYDEQLKIKLKDARVFLESLFSTINNCGDLKKPLSAITSEVLSPIHASPQIDGYRNKCEFSFGYDTNGAKKIGFRLGKHRETLVIESPNQCRHIPTMMMSIVDHFERNIFLASDMPPYDQDTNQGFWRTLTVRYHGNDIMLIVNVCPTGVDVENMNNVKRQLVSNLMNEGTVVEGVRVSSLYFQTTVNSSDPPIYEHLAGSDHVCETLYNMKFHISPSSFFQINTKACEVLYNVVAEMINRIGCETLLDICCGTGTIGICLSKHFKKVIGVELVSDAVKDAERNANWNGVTNCTFICGKAESYINQMVREKDVFKSKCLAVLDPPRAGLDSELLVALRRCSQIKNVIYLSCCPALASKNFVSLCRRPSNRYLGDPFEIVQVVPVDMFPHTKMYEMVILFNKVEHRVKDE